MAVLPALLSLVENATINGFSLLQSGNPT